MYLRPHVKQPLFLLDFNESRIVYTHFGKKKAQIQNFIKIRRVGAEIFHAGWLTDGRTDGHDRAHSCFSQFRGCV